MIYAGGGNGHGVEQPVRAELVKLGPTADGIQGIPGLAIRYAQKGRFSCRRWRTYLAPAERAAAEEKAADEAEDGRQSSDARGKV